MYITAEEFESDIDKYLLISETEDVYISRNGIVISLLTNPFKEKHSREEASLSKEC